MSAQSLAAALNVAVARGGAVWRQNTDGRGRPLGELVMLLPRGSKLPAHSGAPGPDASPIDQRRWHLQNMLRQVIAEERAVRAVDAVRAAHLADAIDDLRTLI